MAKKIVFVNVLLLACVLALAYHLVGAWEEFESQRNLKSILARAEGHAVGADEAPIGNVASSAVLPDLAVIGERDLFRPERRPPSSEPTAPVVVEAPKFPKRPQMQGASQVGGDWRALLTVFDSNRAQGDLRQVGMGDQVQGYQVTEITDTTVVLQWNDVREVIDMFDTEPGARPPAAPARRGGTSITVVRIGSKPAAVETSSTEQSTASGDNQAANRPAGAGGVRRNQPDRAAQRRVGAPMAAPAPVPGQEQPLLQGLVGVGAPRPAAPVENAPDNP